MLKDGLLLRFSHSLSLFHLFYLSLALYLDLWSVYAILCYPIVDKWKQKKSILCKLYSPMMYNWFHKQPLYRPWNGQKHFFIRFEARPHCKMMMVCHTAGIIDGKFSEVHRLELIGRHLKLQTLFVHSLENPSHLRMNVREREKKNWLNEKIKANIYYCTDYKIHLLPLFVWERRWCCHHHCRRIHANRQREITSKATVKQIQSMQCKFDPNR